METFDNIETQLKQAEDDFQSLLVRLTEVQTQIVNDPSEFRICCYKVF